MECKKPTLLQTAPEERIRQLEKQLELEKKKLLVASIIDALKTYDPDSYRGIKPPHVRFVSKDFTEEDFNAFVELLHENERLTDERESMYHTKQCILMLSNGIIIELIYNKEEYRGRGWNDCGPLPVIERGFKNSSNCLIRLAEKDGKRYFKIYASNNYDAIFESVSADLASDYYSNKRPLAEVLIPVSCDELEERYKKMCRDLDASLETTGTDDVRGQDSSGEKGKTLVKVYGEQLSFL